jgi:uncharacterized damage-inducible protein DinB
MTTMSGRANELAARLESANAAVIEAVEGCTPEEWTRVTSSEGWSVGVTARHIAISHLPIMGLVELVANGGDVPPITMDMFHANNAQHAQEHASCTRDEVLEILKRDGTAAAEKLRGLSDEQLDRSAPMAFAGGAQMSAVQLVEGILLAHPAQHLASIKEDGAS